MEGMRNGKGLAGPARPSVSAIDGYSTRSTQGIVRVLVEVHQMLWPVVPAVLVGGCQARDLG